MVATFLIGQFDVGLYLAYLVSTRVAASVINKVKQSIMNTVNALGVKLHKLTKKVTDGLKRSETL